MALIVETGLGILGAEAYASVADTDAFWAARGGNPDWSAAQTAAKEAGLRNATDYLDITFLQGGADPYIYGQGLSFPYEGGSTNAQIASLRRATMLLAPLGLTGPLVAAPVDPGGQVLEFSEKVGDLEERTKYAEAGSTIQLNGVDVSWLPKLLAGITGSFGGLVIGRRFT